MPKSEIRELEEQIGELMVKIGKLQKDNKGDEVRNYSFSTLNGESNLLDFFGKNDKLLVIHNMGEGCRHCTLWADGINAFLPHLESALSVILVSKDDIFTQRKFSNDRGWNFRIASHGGGDYISEQTVLKEYDNMPGAVVYEREGAKIFRKNDCVFGPGDIYCSMYSLLGLAGIGEANWTPQYAYWQRPEKLDDGGKNILG
jgi:predicted dithiol-disulfide oxidoreductase (DUF899 family)